VSIRSDDDARLNAFVDGEADSTEREEVFAAIAADSAVEQRVCEIRRAKSLLRHAYEDVAPPARRAPSASRTRQVAAGAVFALGIATGWMLSAWHGAQPGKGPSPVQAASAASKPMPGVVIQVADADAAKWRLALDQAKAVLDPEWNHGAFDVVIVAYGPGLGMLREGSPVRAAVDASQRQGIRFVACGNTMDNFHVATRELLPGVGVARAGASLEILALERAGYAYVRI
jgi:intracellular sulfur oxidation DsrE/DsrF family protein